MDTPQIPPADLLVRRITAFSRYARQLAISRPELLENRDYAHPYSAAAMEAHLAAAPAADEAELRRSLRRLRQEVMWHLMARDLNGLARLPEIVQTVTALAETTIRFAVARWDEWLRQRHGLPLGASDGAAQDLLVIGMGKLGGGELNVSSDVDLVFAYPEEGETTGPAKISNHEYFTLLGRKLIAALGEVTEDGFVFRVDMRLRPYGDSGPLVSSLDMLESYLITQGREWERFAWIKGRVLCGSRADALNDLVQPFVFRRHLDFGALESMRALHGQIRRQVQRRELGDNIKLGPGGIREIEFIAQVFQLMRGGRESGLRQRPTLAILACLEERRLLEPETAAALSGAYVFLRNLEHRLQYLDDQNTQSLPGNDEDRQRIARSMGCDAYDAFTMQLDRHRHAVTRCFEAIFSTPDTAPAPAWFHAPENGEALPALQALGYRQAEETLRSLMNFRGSSRYRQMPAPTRQRLDRLLPAVVETAAGFPDPELTLTRLLQLLDSIGRREAYLTLLLEYPRALDSVARLASASSWASGYLARHPILLDELLDTRALYEPPDWPALRQKLADELTVAAGDTERQMDILRHFKHATTFRLAAQDLEGLLPLEKLSDHLSDLADTVLQQTLHWCWQGLRTRHREQPAFCIIGYGKLGGKELGYTSDLDLVFLYDDGADTAPENYARLAQRISTWLASLTSAGMLYETDLRLRPNGAAGLLVSSLAAFAEYQRGSAWVWEHQALTRARCVAGDKAVGQAFEALRQELLCRSRDLQELKREVLNMREKMLQTHHGSTGRFHVKHDRGGLVDVEFIVQYLVLGHAHAHPELTRNIGNLALLDLAARLGLIAPELARPAAEAYRSLRRLQHRLGLQEQKNALVNPQETTHQTAAVTALWNAVFGNTDAALP